MCTFEEFEYLHNKEIGEELADVFFFLLRFSQRYSFDLSDPTNPQVTGELKIPGYSDYLQLIDEDHLLAIGRGTIDSNSPRFAWFQEVQVSLFNISDMENPTLLHRYSFEGGRSGQSEALVDPHAFNYLPDHKILAVPFSSGEGHSWEAGLITLKIDPQEGISLLGDVDQPGSVRRSVRINDLLYAVSDDAISVVDLQAPDTVLDTVLLEEERQIHEHGQLLERYLRRFNDIFVSRFTSNSLKNAWYTSLKQQRWQVLLGSRGG